MSSREEILKQIQAALDRKTGADIFPHRRFPNYCKRNGDPSWQHEFDNIFALPSVQECFILCSNSVGKSFKVAKLAAEILENDHPVCKLFNEPIHVHIITQDVGVQKVTFQKEISKITNNEISAIPGIYNSKKYRIHAHTETLKSIHHLQTKNYASFGTAAEGAKGVVGVRPHILLIDEPVSESVYEELQARTTTDKARLALFATVLDPSHAWVIPISKEIQDEESKLTEEEKKVADRRTITAKMSDCPFVPLEKIEGYKKKWGEDSATYRIRVEGSLEAASGIVLEGIEKCVVSNDYVPEEFKNWDRYSKGDPFIWVEVADFGIEKLNPTIIPFFKVYLNGEIVQEDEIIIYEGDHHQWCDEIHRKRHELDMPYLREGDLSVTNGLILDPRTELFIRKPHRNAGDKQYLARRSSTGNSSTKIRHEFAARKIYWRPSKGEKVELGIPIVKALIRSGNFKIKQKCTASLNMAKRHMAKVNKETGKIDYGSQYDHYTDCLRYLCEIIPDNATIEAAIKEQLYIKSNSVRDRINDYKTGPSSI